MVQVQYMTDEEIDKSFSFEEIKDAKAPDGVHYRIRDAADNRMATCYERSNAERIVRLMNLGAGYMP